MTARRSFFMAIAAFLSVPMFGQKAIMESGKAVVCKGGDTFKCGACGHESCSTNRRAHGCRERESQLPRDLGPLRIPPSALRSLPRALYKGMKFKTVNLSWAPQFGGGNLLCLRVRNRFFSVRLPWWLANRMKFVRSPGFHVD